MTAQAPEVDLIGLQDYLRSVQEVIKANLTGRVWVVAELSEFVQKPNGICWLTLVESQDGSEVAKCQAVMYKTVATSTLAKFREVTGQLPATGMKVLLKLSANFHVQYGFQLQVFGIDPNYTMGEMHARIQIIVDKLKTEDIFERQRQMLPPSGYWRVAVVSPEQAAGLGDFRREADILHRHRLVQFDYFSAVFQGESASESIRGALRQLHLQHQQAPYDAVCIIRGGGAKADLAWLNDHQLARWVCRLPIPIYTGIGHERDETVLDLAAHTRYDTPSKVIAAIARHLQLEAETLQSRIDRVGACIDRALSKADSQLAALDTRYHRQVESIQGGQELALQHLSGRSSTGVANLLHDQQVRLEQSSANWDRGIAALVNQRSEQLLSTWSLAGTGVRAFMQRSIDQYTAALQTFRRLVPNQVENGEMSVLQLFARYREAAQSVERNTFSCLQDHRHQSNMLMQGIVEVAIRDCQGMNGRYRQIVPRLLDQASMELDWNQRRAGRSTQSILDGADNSLRQSVSQVAVRAGTVIDQREAELRELLLRYQAAALAMISRQEQILQHQQNLFEALDTRKILLKGFALVRNEQGQVLKSVKQVAPAQQLIIELADGKLSAFAEG